MPKVYHVILPGQDQCAMHAVIVPPEFRGTNLLIGLSAMPAGLPGPPPVVISRLANLDGALLEQVRPSRILCPLLARDFDASLVVARLQALGYDGHLTVVSPPCPTAPWCSVNSPALRPA
jgi:hypothetical protein